MPPRNADPAAPNFKDAFAQLAVAVRGLLGSQAQAQLMRSAAGSDVNIGQSIYQPSEELTARAQCRSIRSFEEQLPADGYMNTSSPTEQHAHRKAHPLTLNGSLNEADTSALIFTETDAIQQSVDQLPLSNFMTVLEPVDDFLRTRVGLHDHEAKPITMKVCGTFQEAIKSHWDSCASACFESSLEHCVPDSFVKLEKKIVTADGGCNSDGMAWRRYHIPINDEWIAQGDEHGFDLRQADVITFAMPPIVATKFPTPVSIIAAPVAKGLFISTNIAAGYHEQDSIMLRRKPDLTYPLHHKANGLPYVAFVDDKLVRKRGLRMISHFDLLPYFDDKAMKMLSIQWKYHDPAGAYWTTVNECFTLMTVGNVPRTLSSRVDQAAPSANRQRCINHSHDTDTVVDVDRTAPAIYDELHNCVFRVFRVRELAGRSGSSSETPPLNPPRR